MAWHVLSAVVAILCTVLAAAGGTLGAPSSMTDEPVFLGWLAVGLALLSFGSFGVPIKSKAVQEAKVHPLVFQSYKTFWALATCWFVLIWEDFHLSPWGLLSGCFWVPAGIAAVVAVNNVGLAVGQATWEMTIIIVSFLWGLVGYHEPIKHPGQAAVAVVLLLSGLLGMTWVASKSAEAQREPGEKDGLLDPTVLPGGKRPQGRAARESGGMTRMQRFGFCAALFNGIWGGSNLVPMKFAHLPGPQYVISFAVGSAVVNTVLWIAYALYLLWQAPQESVLERLPPLHINVMKVSGTISGVLWSIGNFSAMYAVKSLGQAVGYSCVQASIFVSGLWGMLLYGEVRGVLRTYWFCCAVMAIAGVVLLAKQKG